MGSLLEPGLAVAEVAVFVPDLLLEVCLLDVVFLVTVEGVALLLLLVVITSALLATEALLLAGLFGGTGAAVEFDVAEGEVVIISFVFGVVVV